MILTIQLSYKAKRKRLQLKLDLPPLTTPALLLSIIHWRPLPPIRLPLIPAMHITPTTHAPLDRLEHLSCVLDNAVFTRIKHHSVDKHAHELFLQLGGVDNGFGRHDVGAEWQLDGCALAAGAADAEVGCGGCYVFCAVGEGLFDGGEVCGALDDVEIAFCVFGTDRGRKGGGVFVGGDVVEHGLAGAVEVAVGDDGTGRARCAGIFGLCQRGFAGVALSPCGCGCCRGRCTSSASGHLRGCADRLFSDLVIQRTSPLRLDSMTGLRVCVGYCLGVG